MGFVLSFKHTFENVKWNQVQWQVPSDGPLMWVPGPSVRLFERLRQEDLLSPGVQEESKQHSKLLSQKKVI